MSEPQLAARYEGAGGAGGPSNAGGFYGEPAPAVFALPFRGWLALADVVAGSAPETAELMTAAAYLAQSALEERLPDLIHELGDVLTASGFSSGAVEGVGAALLANRLAFTPQAVTEELAGLYADLGKDHRLRSGDNPLELAEAAIEGFLDSALSGPDAWSVYNDMANQAGQYRQPQWWAACSLELPTVLAQPPISCARRRFWVSDRLVAQEWTYRGHVRTGFDGEVKGRGPVGTVTPGGGYRETIDEPKAEYYWDTLYEVSTGLAFTLSLSEGRTWRWANKVARALDAKGEDIKDKVDGHVKAAQADIVARLTAAHAPALLLHPVIGLMATAARAVVNLIFKFLVKSLGDKTLTSWAIWHTAVMGQKCVPISVFTLSRSGESNPQLHYIEHNQGKFTASDDYENYPGFMDEARYMIGASELPKAGFNAGFFDLTERSGHPVIWRDPMESNGGFRILVPHRTSGSKASYVSALRVDVQVEERRKKTARKFEF